MSYQQQVAALSDAGKKYLTEQLGLQSPIDQLVAYYASTATGDLRDTLEQLVHNSLPVHFHPSHYVPLDSLPKLANGKIDINALPAPTREVRQQATDHTDSSQADSHNTEKLAQLIAILESLLDFDGILPSDNFFELGGDSITAIRLVSRAREAGIDISVAALAEQPDFSNLIDTIATTATPQHTPVSPFGEAPLTPIQSWFFSHRHPHPAHWSIAGHYTLAAETSSQFVADAIRQTLAAHTELAVQFKATDDHWHCRYPDTPAPAETCQVVDSNHTIQQLLADYARSFDLQQGWMIRFAILDNSAGDAAGLLWVAHHLITDQLSMDTLLLEIEHRCNNRHNPNHTGTPQNQQLSMREWALLCHDRRLQISPVADKSGKAHSPLFTSQPATEGNAIRANQSFAKMTPGSLQANALKHGLTVPAILISALSIAWHDIFNSTSLALDIEGHGRDLLDTQTDNSSTIGWFSAFHPADIQIRQRTTPHLDRCRDVQAQLDHQKKHNNQFLLACHAPHTFGHNGRLLFNYLGNREAPPGSSLLQPQPLAVDGLRNANNLRSHNIEINATITEGTLSTVWTVSTDKAVEAKTAQFSDLFKTTLVTIVEDLSAADIRDGNGTAFALDQNYPLIDPDVGMDQSDLDDFLDSIDT